MTFLAGIGQRPGRGDALANVLLYHAVRLLLSLCFHRGTRREGHAVFAIPIGGLMSLAMELARYFVPGRDASFSDVATNTWDAAGQARRDG